MFALFTPYEVRLLELYFPFRDHYVVEDITPVRHLKSKLQVVNPVLKMLDNAGLILTY